MYTEHQGYGSPGIALWTPLLARLRRMSSGVQESLGGPSHVASAHEGWPVRATWGTLPGTGQEESATGQTATRGRDFG